jgi:hypothetical protein
MSRWCVATMQSLFVANVDETFERRRINGRRSASSEEPQLCSGSEGMMCLFLVGSCGCRQETGQRRPFR